MSTYNVTRELVNAFPYLSISGYTVFVWWGIVSNLGFLGFVFAILLFFISIPLAPIYVSVQENWEPIIVIFSDLFSALVSIGIAEYIEENLIFDEK